MKGMLEDVRVLDLTHVWFGPWCTMMMADMGAEVIKIEPPWGAIDRIAEGALFGGVSYTFHHLNLNKKDLTLNLKSPEGMQVFKELVKKSDVVVQNFSPGTMEKLGLGYDVLRSLNPRIIYAALSGFGQYGPYSPRGSYAAVVEAMSGHVRLTGDIVDPEGPPLEMAQSLGDLGPGTMAAMAIIAALRHRDRTGEGQMIDVAQFDCMVAYNTAVTGYNLSGLKPYEIRKKFPTGRGVGGLFKTRDGGWINLSGFTPKAIDILKKFLEAEEINKELLAKKISEMTRDEAIEFFVKADIPVGPVYHVDEVVKDPQLLARGMFVEVDHPKAGKVKVPNFPLKLSGTSGKIVSAAPLLGQHNREILKGVLGYSDERIAELETAGVIANQS